MSPIGRISYPLARLSDQFPPYAALIADTNAARLFVFGRGATMRSGQVTGTKSQPELGRWLVAGAVPAPYRELSSASRRGTR